MKSQVTYQQAMQAQKYIESYIKMTGQDPADVLTTPGCEKSFPEDVKKAWDTVAAFDRQNEEEGITI